MGTFFELFIIAVYWKVHGAISGCTLLGEVHPVSAQNKGLISDTVGLSAAVQKEAECAPQVCKGC